MADREVRRYGICDSFCDRGIDLRGGSDPSGPDETNAGAGNGSAGMYGSRAGYISHSRSLQDQARGCRFWDLEMSCGRE